jgi:glutamate synthase domain-containing protein 2
MIRPEIRQYFVESDEEAVPFDRNHRVIAYQRSKGVNSTMAFGTRRDVNAIGYEWVNHSLYPTDIGGSSSQRVLIGGNNSWCTKPYSSSLLNISAMSYGALSDRAILALSSGAKLGGFSHNTGEGGISDFHKEGGADLVWNLGTAYFGAGKFGEGGVRVFDPDLFVENSKHAKMIEIKLSQGAKPAHGGMLPKEKISPTIAKARNLDYPVLEDCHSPPRHSAFSNPTEMCRFIQQLRTLSDGKPIGIKLCLGQPEEFCDMVKAFVETGIHPDFITVDGAEGGTGAAPPEFSNSVGTPLVEGLTFIHSVLVGVGLRNPIDKSKSRVALIASGKVLTGFSMYKNFALGADVCNAARSFLFSLGCIQALKCNTNTCPTGITTQNPELSWGLVRSRVNNMLFWILVV